MGIVTPPMRKAIKTLMAKKYIDSCGIKLPRVPSIPNFTPPPMPSLDMLEEEIRKMNALPDGGASQIYTQEYLDAKNQYDIIVTEAYNKYVDEINSVNNELERLKDDFNINKTDKTLREITLSVQKNIVTTEFEETKKKAREDTKLDEITKFKRIAEKDKKKANKAAKDEIEYKKNEAKQAALELLRKIILEQYVQWSKAEAKKAERLVKEIKSAYNDTVELFKTVKQEADAYFQNGGPGDIFVETECNKIDRLFENFTEAFAELGINIGSMISKIPNPDVIVVGGAAGIPNPGHKIVIFMEDMKKVLTNITKITNYIKEILAIASALGFAIMDTIPVFKKSCDAFEKKQKDVEVCFQQGVKAMRKRQKWFLEHEHPDEEGETRLAGYMYTDARVDWVNHEIEVLGYKCYCKKNYAKKYTENGQVKKSYWLGGYKKNEGPYIDSSGKHYYYIPEGQLCPPSEYNENDLLDDSSMKDYDPDMGTIYDDESNTSTLNLSDGRTIVIDYLAASGDVIRLDDGTVIRVK